MPWIGAAIIGLMIAALHYGRALSRLPNGGGTGRPTLAIRAAAALRAAAATLVVAMLIGAPAAPARPRPPLVALDASASWTRGEPNNARWSRARALARELSGSDSIWLFGDSTRRAAVPPPAPIDNRSVLAPVLDMVRDERRSLVLITDGEFRGGATLPPGTRLTTLAAPVTTDAALVTLIAPPRAAPGDTITVRATIRAGAAALSGVAASFSLGSASAATVATGAIPAFGERNVTVRLVTPRGEREALLRATVAVDSDAEPRNDSLSTTVEVSRVPSAVLVSSSPDPDARAALEALAGALTAPPRGYYQVAPGAWRDATTLRAVSAADVRAAATAAPLLVIHGDSAIFGPPAALARSALVLLLPGEAGDIEWRAAGSEGSPLSPSLAGIAWDSVPPIELAVGAPPPGEWTALSARTPGLAPRAVIVGSDANGRRRVVVAAGGLWRWRARGGPPRDAFDALWGAIADWTTSVAVDVRPALPASRGIRAGEPVTWLRAGPDSIVALTLRRTDAGGGDTTGRPLTIRFSGDARTAATTPLPPGVYVATMRGGAASFVVNASAELLPSRTAEHRIAPGSPPGGVPGAPLRERWWAYVLAVAALCGEWIMRRRAGLR